MRAAVDHAVVDDLGGREAGVEHPDGGEEVREEQGVHDEAGPVGGCDRLLAEDVLREGQGPLAHPRFGEHRVDDLYQRHDRCRVEEVHAEHLAGPGGGAGEPHDGQRGGVGGEDRVRVGEDLVEGGEQLQLQRFVLLDRLDHELPVGEFAEVAGEANAVEGRVAFLFGQLALGDAPVEGPGQPLGPVTREPAEDTWTMTSSPARAHSSATPLPMMPLPTTPTRRMAGRRSWS